MTETEKEKDIKKDKTKDTEKAIKALKSFLTERDLQIFNLIMRGDKNGK